MEILHLLRSLNFGNTLRGVDDLNKKSANNKCI